MVSQFEPQNILQNDTKCKGIRVNLIGEDGRLEVLFLPKAVEGKYLFESHEQRKTISFVWIEAENGRWVLCCSPEACFMGGYSIDTNRIPLVHNQLYYIICGGEKYFLCAELQTMSSGVFHHFRVKQNAVVTIGRDETNTIVSMGRFVSRNHAAMCLTGAGWEIRDLNSANGVYVNRQRVETAKVKLGDMIYLMGLRILVGTDFISVSPGDNEMRIDRSVLSPLELVQRRIDSPSGEKEILFNRSPRNRFSMEWKTIEVDAPPMPMNSNKMPLILRMGSSAVMGGRSIMMGSYSMALTSLVFPFLTQRYNERERKEYEERRQTKYMEYLAEKKKEITDECAHEYQVLNENYPPLNALLQNCGGKRLWERRKRDDDFLTLRVGFGVIQMKAELEFPSRRFEMERDDLEEKMFDLAEKRYLIKRAPVMISFQKDFVTGVIGGRKETLLFLRNLAAQLVMTHSYDEVKCVFLIEKEELRQFADLRYLPHIWDDGRSIRFLATEPLNAGVIGEYLRREMEDCFKEERQKKKRKKTQTHFMVFALSKRLYDSVEILKDVLMEEECVGLSVITAFDELPKECTKVFQMRAESTEHACFDLLHPDQPPQMFELDECDLSMLHQSMRTLANTQLKTISGSFSLPKTFTFLEMFRVGKIEHLNLFKRWSESDPTRSLATPVGIGTDGGLFMLDLHEKRQGPHGLVAGMTGSGKSEFIITYILSMAVNYSPDEVAFVLIDYKGGGLAGAFEDPERGIHLPHLVGTITNLDGAAIARSMISIESELKRRQRIFNEAKTRCNEGTMDIYTYQRLYRNHQVDEPLPHLFIISDEFAELKSQQPDFMDKLISTARIGRSLGVHLILATQKPAGVVNDQIWSNTKFRVCLRVQDKGDSQDMLKRPEAAELKDTGRFYLQVGYNEYFALGQSAWCGADYIPQNEVISQKDESVHVIDDTAQTLATIKPVKRTKSSGIKQIVAVVQYLSTMAKREHLIPRNLLPPMLPEKLTIGRLMEMYPTRTPVAISAQIGMIDDPAFQQQYAFELNVQNMHNMLIVGESSSGKTNLVQTILLSLMERYTPEQVNFFILDFSSKLLTRFRSMLHCSAVLTDDDEPAIDWLFEMVSNEIKRRQKLFAQAEVNSYEDYCILQPLPLVLVIIDGLVNFTSIKKGNMYYSTIHEYMRDGAGYGVKFILAGSHYNEFSMRVRQEASVHLGMNLKDRYAYYDVMGVKSDYVPPAIPGRGLCLWDGRPLEFQTAIFSLEEDPKVSAQQLQDVLQRIQACNQGCTPAPKLSILSETETYDDFCKKFAPGRIPLGYTVDSIKAVSLPLKQMFTTAVYFGNKLGIAPVMDNLLHAYCAEHMELLIVKRSHGTLFADDSERVRVLRERTDATFLNCTIEDIDVLLDRLLQTQAERLALRKEYVRLNHLDVTDPDNTMNAFDYIHERTKPLMVIFESYYEVSKELNIGQVQQLSALLEAKGPNEDNSEESLRRRGRGYNIYYTACFLPNEYVKVAAQTSMGECFNPQKFTLLFGGQLDKAGLVVLPKTYMSVTAPAERYNRFVMHYNGKLTGMMMPCGELLKAEEDPDEVAIV